MKKERFVKVLIATTMALSYIPINHVHAIEQGVVDIKAISDVNWCGEIPGYGTYPQREIETITLQYSEDVKTALKSSDYKVTDIAENKDLTIKEVKVSGKNVTLNVTANASAGVLTAPGGNFRRLKSEFKITNTIDIEGKSGNILTEANDEVSFDQDNIQNIASDEFKDLIVDSKNSKNKIYVKYYLPDNYNPNKEYPMVVHHTGGGQHYRTDTPDENIYGKDNFGVELDIDLAPKTFSVDAPEDTIMVTIQCLANNKPENYSPGKDINQIVHYFIDNYSVDTNRIYAVGNSQGGVDLSEAVYLEPSLYAAYLPCNTSIVSGDKSNEDTKAYLQTVEYCQAYVDNEVGIWFHRGENDFTGPYTEVTIPYDILVNMYKDKGYSEKEISKLVKQTKYSNADFEKMGSQYYHGATGLMCLNEKAIQWTYDQSRANTTKISASYDKAIDEVIIPRYEEDGKKIEQKVSDTLKTHLKADDLVAEKDINAKTLTVDVQLKDVRLSSDYLNGKSEPGVSYYNMLNFYTDVKQVKQLLDSHPNYRIIDNQGNKVDTLYVEELLGLLDQINDFDPTTNLKYDYDAVYDSNAFSSNTDLGGTDVIATSKEGNVSFKFHIDSHGYWGYDLGAHDSITGIVMGYDKDYAYENQHDLTTKYANFFVIEMENTGSGKWYMLNNTDLENPMIYVSSDGKEAFMIDVDFYGENVINDKIKNVIGDKCESLKIFLTHNHGDHVNNLAKIAEDDYLKDIITIIWPENEPHTVLNNVDLVELFDYVTIKDMEKINVAGNTFQFIEIPNEHTPGGGQLADLTNKVIYSGDSLGAQVHLGGTTIKMSNADNWLLGAQKSAHYIKDNGIKYNIGGHTPYLNTADFASWVATAVQYAKDQVTTDSSWEGGLVIVENGVIVTGERMGEIFANGLSDRDELKIASVNFINDLSSDDKEDNTQINKNPDIKDENIETNNQNTKNNVKTDDFINITPYVLLVVLSCGLLVMLHRKKDM